MSALMQAIPEGFKQTEVGIIPEDWNAAPLHEVCSFGGGTTPPRSQHDRYFVGGNNNWIKTTDLNNSLLEISEEQITDLAIAETGLKKHPVGSVLVAMYGGFNQIGRTGYITQPSSINQALVAVKPKPKKLHSYYLLSELNYNVDYWKGVASSSRKDPNITSNDVKNYKIALPSVEEQTAIANALSDVDTLLMELEKLIAKKQAIKTATMQQLLTGKTRLPQFAAYTKGEKQGVPEGKSKGTKPSKLGEIPEDWYVCLIDDVVSSLSSGGTPFRGNPSFYKGLNRWITSGELKYGVINDTIEKISDDAIKKSHLKVHPKGTFLMAITGLEAAGTRGSCGIVGKPAATNQSCMAIYPNKKLTSNFLFHWYVYNGEELALTYCQGTKQLSYTAGLLKTLPILLPRDTDEQTAIATILSDMDNEIQTLKQRLAKTRQIKQGMMQQLLTGRTRLPFKQAKEA
ncbi:MAG: type I restriction enzyme S subunit [Pseudoalteromonas rhizosphaerae]|jgi:type I restriction enzyme S subunit|uniref:restriction endonuclease subunit S n=1 Tax=Pseudoalteromonas rhizosphaerae TaxID=2518973 RepID=UPI0039E359C9